ncbi:AraC family transcriptional regulator [Prolixibacteraceae bacterium Z1-6]|uniref:AraC family transcriptional regulator n=1 Tax=Draconibacterium aestuarii TaxID=2998507 RepID=A0A9X3F6L9_9BACT|nr:AraC family transcriptional regulator [Prolixibacteraceae bacterium Z1-6]
MSDIQFTPIVPAQLYAGLVKNPSKDARRLSGFVKENVLSGNNYIDLFADKVRTYGKGEARAYAKIMGVDYRYFDGAIRCLTGMTVHGWITEYLRLVACDLVEHTNYTFKDIAKMLGFSQSSFTQFFRKYVHMQPWEYRNLKRHGRKSSFFYS